MTNIKLYAEMLRPDAMPQRQVEYYLGVLSEQADRLGELIQDILEITALDSGQALQRWEPLAMPTIIRDVLTRFEDSAAKAGLELTVRPLPDQLPQVNGDHSRISRALAEVVENAIVFTQPGGKISIQLSVEGAPDPLSLVVSVTDTGPGISLEEQDRIFDHFYRGSLAESGHVPGTGLGLSMAQQILQVHGGSIQVESELGRGSTFALRLLAAPAEKD